MSRHRPRIPSNSDDESPSLRILPRAGGRGRRSRGGDDFVSSKRRRGHLRKGYKEPGEKQSSKVELRFSVFNGTSSHCWRFTHFTFDSRRVEDKQLWQEIGDKYRDELQGAWRRIYGFKKLKKIIPVAVCDSLLRSVFRFRAWMWRRASEFGWWCM